MNDRFKLKCFNKLQNKIYEVRSISYYQGNIKRIEVDDNGKILIFDDYENNIDNCILIQCTGLKDKNGKLIFEGDIVNQIYEDSSIHRCEVIYNNCSFQLKFVEKEKKNYITTPMYCYAINYLGHYTEKKLEVIGNIYENKELLNEI